VEKEKVVSRTDQHVALLWEFFFLYCLKEFQFLTVFNYAKEKNNISVYRCVQVIQKTYVGGMKDLLPQVITVFIKWTVHQVFASCYAITFFKKNNVIGSQ